ncbi:MAG TPA: pyruvate kinase [Candidatus Saccharimonadales bacterium]|jgi:pyruvate kinase|nr:pyruvate kinase [Candidatus Saccharimonadales bacterium]
MITPKIFKRAKILATLGPSTDSYEIIHQLIEAGVNGFRLNFSHGTYEERDRQIPWIRQASKELGKPVAILQDLQGPKIRLGELDGVVPVKKGESWQLTYGQPSDPTNKKVAVQYDLSQKVKVGERLYIFDGKVRTTVTKVDGPIITIRIENDGVLMQKKGLNLPDTDFGGDILTEKDLKDIEFGATRDIDYVALSFVQTADDMNNMRQILLSHGSTAQIISKIETKAAIAPENLEKIVMASDGVMVARGDLAVEVSPEVVPIAQRQILGLCQKHSKLSIVATQMMASMVDSPEPTRAEVSDVANAVITGTDCVMLSDETANGKYPLETVAAMKRVILYTQEHAPVRPVYFREGESDQQDAISAAAVTLAQQIKATAIVAETKSGATAESIAAHRPSMPIISVTSDPRVAQQLALLYANKSFLRPDGETAGFELAKELRQQNFFGPNTTVILVSGRQPGLIGATDTIRVRVLE